MEGINNYFIKNGERKNITDLAYQNDGEIIYEVLRVINRVPLFLEDHFFRLRNTFLKKGVKFDLSLEECRDNIINLCNENNVLEGNIKIIYPIEEGSIYYFFIKHSYPTEKMYLEGVKTILYFGERNNPNEKIVNNSFRDKVNEEIKNNKAFEAILVDRNGIITEGSRSNIFMIRGNSLITSPIEGVLPGVTRKNIIEVANEKNIEIIETKVNYKDLNSIDALFISGTSPKVLPISEVGGQKFDINNSLLRELMISFNEKLNCYITSK